VAGTIVTYELILLQFCEGLSKFLVLAYTSSYLIAPIFPGNQSKDYQWSLGLIIYTGAVQGQDEGATK